MLSGLSPSDSTDSMEAVHAADFERAGKIEAMKNGAVVLGKSASVMRSLAVAFLLAGMCSLILPGVTLKALGAALSFLLPLAEALNEALEMTVDRLSPEWHPLSRDIKDLGSCLVPMSCLPVLVVLAMSSGLTARAVQESSSWGDYIADSWEMTPR